MKKYGYILLAAINIFILLAANGCPIFKEHKPFECSLVELKENPVSQYYDVVIKVESIVLKNPLKMRFALVTPTSFYEVADLNFSEDGGDPELLEKGDVFVLPLKKPDWKFFIREQNDIYCSLNFWEMLPERDQWHPTKSEAMQVAQSIEVVDERGILKPAANFLPPEWRKTLDELPVYDEPFGNIQYQKLRGDKVREAVDIRYAFLTEEEKYELNVISEAEFLSDWTDWTKKFGQPDLINGRKALYWDMQGMGSFGWSYRYVYIDGDMVIEVTLNADPLEWVKTEHEKELERRTERVFLRYGFGPVGDPEWQILIEIRLNRTGAFHKRSRHGITVEKQFRLEDWEFEEIENVLRENRFLELESRSGLPGGITSFISVRYENKSYTVEMKNIILPFYQNIEKKIQRIVLPKVGEQTQLK